MENNTLSTLITNYHSKCHLGSFFIAKNQIRDLVNPISEKYSLQ